MGIVSQRRRRGRAQRVRRRLMIAAGVLLVSSLAMAPQLREWIAEIDEIPVFEQSVHAEMTLPKREMFALQLGVFDSGERAASEAQRLQKTGVRCIVWQREKMRVVSAVALSRESLDLSSAGGNDAYVIKDVLPKVTLRIQAGTAHIARVQHLLETPDEILMHLLTGEVSLETLVSQAKQTARAELASHPEHALYTQLAQSLTNWCALMEATLQETDEATARSYAAVTICTLCRELRLALSQASEASTASAQRTPSTAADVMPPA